MPNVTAGYGRLYDSIAFFKYFSYIATCLKRYNFIKLSQTECLGISVEIKSNPM